MSAIVRFLAGEGVDAAGRSLGQILHFDDGELERRHDYIQWLFPLQEPSRAVPGSPVLAGDDVRRIRASQAAQANLVAAAARMSAFYARTDYWLARFDHNQLRITRIIKSLRLLVSDEAADGFRREILALVETAKAPVNPEALRFWAQA